MAATVRDVYLTRIVRVAPHAMLADVEHELVSGDGNEAYVVGDDGQLLGLVPDYELLKLRMLNLHDVGAAADVMTPVPLSVTLDTPLEEAACHLRVHVHRSLPVLDNGMLVGRIERCSVLSWYANADGTAKDAASASSRNRVAPARPKFLGASTATSQHPHGR